LPATIPGPGGVGTVLNPNDPFASKGYAALINYAFGPLGPGETYLKNHNARMVADLSGKWAGWNYSGDIVFNHTWLDYELGGYINYPQLVTDVTNGSYNFINPSANSPALLSALAPRVTQQDTSDMDSVVLRASRTLAQLPGAALGLALGAEWRYEAEYDAKILSFVYEAPGQPNLQYAGFQSPYNLSSGAGTPQWRGTFTNTWTDGPLSDRHHQWIQHAELPHRVVHRHGFDG